MKFMKLAPFLAALILAGCQNQPGPTPIVELPRNVGPPRGIDMPIDANDVLNELQGIRLDFVARYYRDPASRWPTLSANEVRRLSSLGLKIVTVWEWHSHDPAYFSYASGYGDAMSAYRQAKTVGQTAGSAIYFAVDFNAHAEHLAQIDQYFRGVAAGFAAAGNGRPEYKIGVYGSGAVCAAVKGARLAQYSWLSGAKAWSGSASYTGWNIRQNGRFANLSFNHDANQASDDYGGFRLASAEPTAPSSATASDPIPQMPPPPDRSFAAVIRSWF